MSLPGRLHLLTKHRVFSGPGFQVAVEVGDSADGGQVLMTHDAWLRLEENMAAAGFPTIKQIGLFKLNAWPSPMWLYEVCMQIRCGRQHAGCSQVCVAATASCIGYLSEQNK